MIIVPAGTRILLATRPIDFRKGAALAQEVLAEDPFSGTVIVYRSKRSSTWDDLRIFGAAKFSRILSQPLIAQKREISSLPCSMK
jgi:hypothetical protein